jgi:hypothetical protein
MRLEVCIVFHLDDLIARGGYALVIAFLGVIGGARAIGQQWKGLLILKG